MSKSPALNELLMRPSKRRLLMGPNKHIPAWLPGTATRRSPAYPMHPYGRNAAVCQCERRDMRPRISSRFSPSVHRAAERTQRGRAFLEPTSGIREFARTRTTIGAVTSSGSVSPVRF